MNSDPLIPRRILVAGDWHDSTAWACGIINRLPDLLPDEVRRILLHCGEVSVWPGRVGTAHLEAIENALWCNNAELWFVDGNHEDFGRLRTSINPHDPMAPVAIDDSIRWLPRGYRWKWHGRTWLALGGAVSVDRVARKEGSSWWPDEEITEAQHRHIVNGGPADVMLCHDAPSSVPLRLPLPPSWWAPEDLERAGSHRERLQAITDEVRPSHLMHGHYHLSHDTTVDMAHGPVQVTGLDQAGAVRGNYRVLNIETMEWES